MSAALENTNTELYPLVGGTIEKIWVEKRVGDDWMPQVVRMRVRYANGTLVNDKTHGEYELWQDEEGNGPGYLSFVQEG